MLRHGDRTAQEIVIWTIDRFLIDDLFDACSRSGLITPYSLAVLGDGSEGNSLVVGGFQCLFYEHTIVGGGTNLDDDV